MDITLEKIDIIRERTGVSTRKAKEALERAGGDVVEALILLEEEAAATGATWQERIQVRGQAWLERLKQLIREGNVTRVIVRHDNQTLLEIPVTAGVVGALLMPTLAAIGVVAAMVTGSTIIVERREPNPAGAGAATRAGADREAAAEYGGPPRVAGEPEGGQRWADDGGAVHDARQP